ncbi:MAG: N-acetylmuramoyl-L-alanine amidase [Alphaproteobacteria bacterium]|nr:N-acetylmuramoyl-L-alanine amidase [Alphaproteobacteria bacterium]
MEIIQHPLIFWNERPQSIDTIVLHCSAHEPNDMVCILTEEKLSSHYIIGTNGEIWQLVPEEKRAWHAGISYWRGQENLNHRSIGIELSSPSMGQKTYSKTQMQSLLQLCQDIIKRNSTILPQNIVAHSDIAPTRKVDPGKAFPWAWLAANGIGLWYDINDAEKIAENNAEKLLNIIGYNTANSAASAYAFCRHFAPYAVTFEEDIRKLIDNVYPQNFVLPPEILPILKAVAYRYQSAIL